MKGMRTIDLRGLAREEQKLGAVVTLRGDKTYYVAEIVGGFAKLLPVAPPKVKP